MAQAIVIRYLKVIFSYSIVSNKSVVSSCEEGTRGLNAVDLTAHRSSPVFS